MRLLVLEIFFTGVSPKLQAHTYIYVLANNYYSVYTQANSPGVFTSHGEGSWRVKKGFPPHK